MTKYVQTFTSLRHASESPIFFFSPLSALAQIREQMFGPDLHVFTLKFLALKETVFFLMKNTFQNFFDFCLLLFYATFKCGPYNIFKKN